MSNFQISSYQEILGTMIARMLATTDLNDLNPGSVFLTIMEAAAAGDFSQEGKLIQLLNLKNVDKASGLDLEALAFELGVTPKRYGTEPATVQVTITDLAYLKVSSTIYAGAVAPFAGSSEIKIVDGAGFLPNKTIYIGRGTSTSEAANALSVVQTGAYWTITLAAPLTKDHLVGESVVMAQVGDRTIQQGTIVQVPAFGGSPAISFSLLNDALLLDGESSIDNVYALATDPGSLSNVSQGNIIEFGSIPFSTAAVTNPNAATGGRDIETDEELRQRIKSYVHTLGKGTEIAINQAVVGLTDSEENKRVVSAHLRKPTSNTDQTVLFIDDGSGYAPPFAGIGVEEVVTSAVGTEQLLQLQQWPLVKAQIASVNLEPFALFGTESLAVEVDGQIEQKVLPGTNYLSPGVVTAQEVAEAINGIGGFTTIEARAKNGQLFITPVAADPNYIKVDASTTSQDANNSLKFPTIKQYTIRLYNNDVLLEKNGAKAIIQSLPSNQWTGIGSSETLQLNIDGIDSPIITFTDAQFALLSSSSTIAAASITDWAILINAKFIGVTALGRNDSTFTIQSNKGATSKASLSVIGGSLATKLFAANVSSKGNDSAYSVNRLSGQVQLANRLSSGDKLTAGTINTRGFAETFTNGSYILSAVGSLPPQIVLIDGGTFTPIPVVQSGTITFSSSSGVQKITGSVGQFSQVAPNDTVYLYNLSRNGILIVKSVSSNGSFINCFDPSPISGSDTLNPANNQLTIYRTDSVSQIVNLPVGLNVSNTSIVNAINTQSIGLNAEALDTNAIRIRTNRFSGGFGLGIPALGGTAMNMGLSTGNYLSNDPHTASIESANLEGIPHDRYLISSSDSVYPYVNLSVVGSPFTAENSNKPILPYIGSESKFIREPKIRLSSSELTLRSDVPIPTIGLGSDLRATSVTGMEFGQTDNMVFLIDNDANTKTFDIPLYIDGTIGGASTPTINQMDLIDTSNFNLGSSSNWLGYRFEDYRIWFQAKGDLPTSVINSEIRVKSNAFGPNGENIQVGIFYPQLPDSVLLTSFSLNPLTDKITVSVFLESSSSRTINLQPNSQIQVSSVGSVETIQFVYPTDLSTVLLGDILSLSDPAFSAQNQTQIKISSISNLVDFSQAYNFLQESASCTVTGNNTISLSAPASNTVRIGDKITIGSVTALITSVTDNSNFAVSGTPFLNGGPQSGTLTHSAITASAAPSFAVAIGDKLQIGPSILTITSVYSPTEYAVDQPFTISTLTSGIISRIRVSGSNANAVVNETHLTSSSQGVQIFPLKASKNNANNIITLINGTAGVNNLIVAVNAAGSSGAGVLAKSTLDESGSSTFALKNGQSYIYSVSPTSPSFRLKEPVTVAPDIGEKIRLVPMTPRNIYDHFSRKQISGLTVAANVDLVDQGRKVQVSSKTVGGLGQVYAIGGSGSGNNLIVTKGIAQEISSNKAQIEMDISAIELLTPGNTIKIFQTGRAQKKFVSSSPISSTTIEIQLYAAQQGKAIFGVPLVNLYSYSQTGSPVWAVRNIGRNRIRFEVLSGNASVPALVKVDDWVLVGNGSSYAGITTDMAFAPANQGWFQIRETDNSTYFDVDGIGIDEMVSTSGTSFIFTSYHSARVGDQIVFTSDSPLSTNNRGTYNILDVPDSSSVIFSNPNVETQAPIALGSAGTLSIHVLDQGYSTYRKVTSLSPNPNDPTNTSFVVVTPGYDLALINEAQGAVIAVPNKLGYSSDPVPGIAAYNYWTGLKRAAQRVVDGFEPDTAAFSGVGASGVSIEVREPQIQRIKLSLIIKTSQGVSLQSISDSIKSAIDGYINSLGLASDVVISEVITVVQELPGVDSVVMVTPAPGTERITVNTNSIARITADSITLG